MDEQSLPVGQFLVCAIGGEKYQNIKAETTVICFCKSAIISFLCWSERV
jgi:hypothetical protein